MPDANRTALILIGFQNDYFRTDGALAEVLEPTTIAQSVLDNTLRLIERCRSTNLTIVSTPILFTPDYSELNEPVGILKAIKEAGAFRRGAPGAETVTEIRAWGNRILEVPGKRGLNAFSNTDLHAILAQEGCSDVALAGVVASLCIDSTGRAAFEHGFYCEKIFPLYAQVTTGQDFLESIRAA